MPDAERLAAEGSMPQALFKKSCGFFETREVLSASSYVSPMDRGSSL